MRYGLTHFNRDFSINLCQGINSNVVSEEIWVFCCCWGSVKCHLRMHNHYLLVADIELHSRLPRPQRAPPSSSNDLDLEQDRAEMDRAEGSESWYSRMQNIPPSQLRSKMFGIHSNSSGSTFHLHSDKMWAGGKSLGINHKKPTNHLIRATFSSQLWNIGNARSLLCWEFVGLF